VDVDVLLGSDQYSNSVPGDKLRMVARYKLLPAALVGTHLCQHGLSRLAG